MNLLQFFTGLGILLSLLNIIYYGILIINFTANIQKHQLTMWSKKELATYRKQTNDFLRRNNHGNTYILYLFLLILVISIVLIIIAMFNLIDIGKTTINLIAVLLMVILSFVIRHKGNLDLRNRRLILKELDKEPNSYLDSFIFDENSVTEFTHCHNLLFISILMLSFFSILLILFF